MGCRIAMRNTIFAGIPMESLFSGVLPYSGVTPQEGLGALSRMFLSVSVEFHSLSNSQTFD